LCRPFVVAFALPLEFAVSALDAVFAGVMIEKFFAVVGGVDVFG
jgi:hypothetical protein